MEKVSRIETSLIHFDTSARFVPSSWACIVLWSSRGPSCSLRVSQRPWRRRARTLICRAFLARERNEQALRSEALGGARKRLVVQKQSRSSRTQGRVAAAQSIGIAIGAVFVVAMDRADAVKFPRSWQPPLSRWARRAQVGLKQAASLIYLPVGSPAEPCRISAGPRRRLYSYPGAARRCTAGGLRRRYFPACQVLVPEFFLPRAPPRIRRVCSRHREDGLKGCRLLEIQAFCLLFRVRV